MKLQAKLLLGVGVLLVSMIIVMYILPAYFVKRDVDRATDEVHSLLVENLLQPVHTQQIWLEDILSRVKQNIDSLLLMIFDQELHGPQPSSETEFWKKMTTIGGYDPDIGLIQMHSTLSGKTFVLAIDSARFHPTSTLLKEEKMAFFTLHDGVKSHFYLGFPLPPSDDKSVYYVLIDPKNAESEIDYQKKIEQSLVTATPPPSFHEEGYSSAYLWAMKVNMIRALAPFMTEGISKIKFPEGIVRLDPSGKGIALLSSDLFRREPLFNDRAYFEAHPSLPRTFGLANGSTIIEDTKFTNAYIGNTLLVGSTYITIGTPLDDLVRELALSSNKTIILNVNKLIQIGFDDKGNKLSEGVLKELTAKKILEQQQGVIAIQGTPFFFSRLSALEGGGLVFYNFHPIGKMTSIIETLFNLENKLAKRISIQLLLISLAAMVLVLLFVGRFIVNIIQPITKLARATRDVASGKYESISLPEVGGRRDEVATLTHAFYEMVEGLKEREKIRGVLDKVVSKEVAEEILRTQIHLGGEDRVVSMLFSDIRGFTQLSEELSPQETIGMLNACMTKISRVIEGEGGVIDKYVGDEVMAIFGAPTNPPDHGLRAVSSGILMIQVLQKWNEERAAEGQPLLEMGIGIHTGIVVAGNMGAEDRLNYTVLGRNVNLASRLCDIAKPNQLIISENTLAEAKVAESFYVNELPQVTLEGFTAPVRIFEVAGFKWDIS